ncbi:putative siderochrome-iron transporter [Polychaeton citri CBS 116435]|uniref:Siderochrome-iron transporter n=1 Tax=Polychaeton citri CBS 116435 TaxID=1314669 RepID=A0A9P4UP17_9PEZI|nr:putative siderochrome-iron transporter [Polychaeton citri CBS 116435]
MRVFDQLRGRKNSPLTEGPFSVDADEKVHGSDTQGSSSDSDTLSLEAQNAKEVQEHPDEISKNADLGVQKAEAVALVWSRKAVIATYAWIWVCFFMLAFQSSVMSYSTFEAYSAFSSAPAYTTASILGNIIGGVLKLPIAKMINIWGRAEGFFFFFVIYLVGIVILASTNGPDGYAAGYVLYWIGYDALYLIMQIFIADTSGLRNRAWAFAFVNTPFICTAFTGPLAAQSYLSMTTWRWAVGSFAIIQPVVFLPLGIVFIFFQNKARKQGLFVREPSGRTTMQSVLHYIHEFDVIGAVLLMAAFVIFLLPFSLATYGRATYDSATFIAMVVVGILLFPVFAVWERFFARTAFVRWELFKQRTILGACILSVVLYFSFYSWDLNFYSFVKVVYALSVSDAGYMTQIYNVGSCFWGVVFGVWVYYTKHFKYACLCFGLPLMMLGAGLTIHFRESSQGIGYLVMCQIFIAFAGGTLVIGEDMAIMASSDRAGIAMALAILSLSASVGGAIGDAVSGSIFSATWQSSFLTRISDPTLASQLYLGGYLEQENYAPGTPTRDAIDYAWGQVEKWCGVSATAVLALAIPAIAMWKNYSVDKKQNKGTVL